METPQNLRVAVGHPEVPLFTAALRASSSPCLFPGRDHLLYFIFRRTEFLVGNMEISFIFLRFFDAITNHARGCRSCITIRFSARLRFLHALARFRKISLNYREVFCAGTGQNLLFCHAKLPVCTRISPHYVKGILKSPPLKRDSCTCDITASFQLLKFLQRRTSLNKHLFHFLRIIGVLHAKIIEQQVRKLSLIEAPQSLSLSRFGDQAPKLPLIFRALRFALHCVSAAFT